ncbi:hypothetical protein [Methylotenera sp.]|uniref:hypothetical protein n=1 Tax=Methylotenera sp. TaxID=2051956 RepID=UPI0024885C78|nr:hypothetical protein [Methylotenera sp.]MDI1298924.1 hypothetical protein [Methylotenera sp.]
MAVFRCILYSVFLNLILILPVLAAEELNDVPPDSSIGLGKYSLRIKVLDPVNQKPWANKPYHFVAYQADGSAATILRGNTDSDGYGATVYSTQKIAHYAAVPKMQTGNFAYTTKIRLMQNNGEANLSRAIYIYFFQNGSVFTGRMTAQGGAAEIGSNDPLSVITKIQWARPGKTPEICDWQSVATILNQSMESSPSQKIDLIKQAIEWESLKNEYTASCTSFYEQYADDLIAQLLKASVEGGQALIDVTIPFVVDTKAELLSKLAKTSRPIKHRDATEYHILAILDVMSILATEPTVLNEFFNRWANQAITLNGQIKRLNDQDTVLNLAEKLAQLKKYSAAEKVLTLLTEDSAQENPTQMDETDKARRLTLRTLIANASGKAE